MATSFTARFGLPIANAGTDPVPGRVTTNEIYLAIEGRAAIMLPAGPIADRPQPGTGQQLYLAIDQGDGGRLYVDNGSQWVSVAGVGGGGPGLPIAVNGNGVEGTSSLPARADHTHPLPLANASRHGALSSEHFAMLQKASSIGAAGSLVISGTGGDVVVATNPAGPNSATSKTYVDNIGTPAPSGGVIVRRWSGGEVSGPDPTRPEFYATKRYVDNASTDAGRLTGVVPYDAVGGSSWAFSRTSSTTNTYGTCMIDSAGRFWRYTSALKYKTDVNPLGLTLQDALLPESVEYTDKDTGERRIGFIADKLSGGPLDKLVIHGEDGDVEGFHYFLMPVVQQVAIKALAAENERLKAENTKRKREIRDLNDKFAVLQREVEALHALILDEKDE